MYDNDIELYWACNEGKSVVVERFIRNLKKNIYKYMKLMLKEVHTDRLDDKVNEYKNTQNRIKMKLVDVN